MGREGTGCLLTLILQDLGMYVAERSLINSYGRDRCDGLMAHGPSASSE